MPQKTPKAIALLTGLVLCLSACDEAPSKPGQIADYDLIFMTKEALKKRLKDPDSAEFTDVHVSAPANSPDKKSRAVCGYVNAKNGFGGKTGLQKFVGAGDAVFMEEDGAAAVEEVWTTFGCDLPSQ